jgi:hypothetical protein
VRDGRSADFQPRSTGSDSSLNVRVCDAAISMVGRADCCRRPRPPPRRQPSSEGVMLLSVLMAATATSSSPSSSSPPPSVYRDAMFEVKEQMGLQYAQGVLCGAQPCTACIGGLRSNGPAGCDESCLPPLAGPAPMPPTAHCKKPSVVNLTLDLYTPVNVPSALGPRPAFVRMRTSFLLLLLLCVRCLPCRR